jgi:hypothetical protein
MKFRTVTIWIALVSTGMLCLAVGAVRIPRKPRNPLGQSESSSSTRNEQQETATVIPMRVEPPGRQPAMSNFPGQNQTSPTSAAWGQPVRSQAASQQPQRQSIDRTSLPLLAPVSKRPGNSSPLRTRTQRVTGQAVIRNPKPGRSIVHRMLAHQVHRAQACRTARSSFQRLGQLNDRTAPRLLNGHTDRPVQQGRVVRSRSRRQ